MSETLIAIGLGALLFMLFGLVPYRGCTGHCPGCTGACGRYREEGDHRDV